MNVYVVILYAAEGQISVIHRLYSVFCHRRAGFYGRTSLEGIAGVHGSWNKGPRQRTRGNLCMNDGVVHTCVCV